MSTVTGLTIPTCLDGAILWSDPTWVHRQGIPSHPERRRLRISLGLKPLSLDVPKVDEEARKRVEDVRKAKEKEERAQQFIARQAE